MRILITGGAGFIGSHVAEHFCSRAEVRVLDNLRSGYRGNLDGMDVEFVEGSVTDSDAVARAVKDVDYVFHLAAMVSVPESMGNPVECVQINTQGLLNVMGASAEAGVKKLCFTSSAAIYGDNPQLPKREEMLPEPKSPYAVTKLDGEYYCRMFRSEGWLDTVCLRYFNVFGPRQDPGSAYAAAVPIFIRKAVCNEDITIFGDGQQTRDFVFVKDVVAANAFFATESDVGGVYNVAWGQTIAIDALARMIVELTGSQSKIVHAEERSGDVKHSCASVDKAAAAGFRPSHTFDSVLRETIDSFIAAMDLRR